MKSLLLLKPYLRPHWPLLLASLLLALPLAGLRAGPALGVKYAMSSLSHPEPQMLTFFALAVIGWYLVNFFVRFFHYYCIRLVIGRVNLHLKRDLFDHMLGLSAEHFSEQKNGVLVSRVGQDPNDVVSGISCINEIVREPLTFFFLLSYTLYLNWKLTLIIFFIIPPMAFVFSATGRNLKRYIARIQEANGEIFTILQETFSGVRIVQAFRLKKYMRKRFREKTEKFSRFYLKTALLEEAAHPLVELLIAILIAAIIYVGGMQIYGQTLTFEELMSFYAAFALMMDPIRRINDINMKLHQASGSCKRMGEIFAWKSSIIEPATPAVLTGFSRSLSFHDVRFAYPDQLEREILRGVSFEITKNQTFALVGESGAGKSSLVQLLPRVFDITAGSIRIDGVDLREFRVDDLRKQIAIVSQDVFLFNDTILENIRCGRFSATQEEVYEAARRAHALDFIDRLPDGMQTTVGDRGQKLSGGERQRISIARAFLKEAPILILDEATSSLDNASEKVVQEALENLMQNRTTLVIAHRLSTVRNADRILVLKQGLVVEQGTHDELRAQRGEYERFLRLAESSSDWKNG